MSSGHGRRALLKGGVALSTAMAMPCTAPRAPAAALELGPWVGAVTDRSAWIKARMVTAGMQAQLLVSTHEDLRDATVSALQTARAEADKLVDFRIDGLRPNVQYHYAIQTEAGIERGRAGRFRTFPQQGHPASFRFVSGSCCRDDVNAKIFDEVAEDDPLFLLHLGDLHYGDVAATEPELFRAHFRRALSSERQGALYRKLPLAYTWDDHDFGPDNSDSRAPGRTASRLTYQEYHCHYPLAAGQGDVPIHQSFVVGRVKFILTDLRSERVPGGSMMGASQLEWFKQQLQAAKAEHPLVVWACSVPYIGGGGDDWNGYAEERQVIAETIKEIDLAGVAIICGDAHMLAADDGRNSNFVRGAARTAIPVFQTAAFSSPPSEKGGPYSHGAFPGTGQFGRFEIHDDGHKIHLNFSGRRANAEIMKLAFDVPAAPYRAPPTIEQPDPPPRWKEP